MPKVFKVLFLSAFFAALTLSVIYFPELKENFTHEKAQEIKEEAALLEVNQLLALGRPLDALNIVKEKRHLIDPRSEKGTAWLEALLKGSEALPDPNQLKELFYYDPELFIGRENASLILAEKLIADGDSEGYTTLRRFFKNQETEPAQWMILNADNLLLQGDGNGAVATLKSRYFEGTEDTPRLLRLALLYMNHHPRVAWDYLEQAKKKDPSNLDISLFRARLLESSGKKDLAEIEWDNALKKGLVQDVALKDELVDFYLRNQSYDKALNLLDSNLAYAAKDPLLLKALFVSKTIEPLPFSFTTKDAGLKSYLSSLPEGKFWDEAHAPDILKAGEALGQAPSSLWLRMLENLRTKRESDALTLLNNDMREISYDPALKDAMADLLEVRINDKAPSEPLLNLLNLPFNNDREVEAYLKGPDAFMTLLLARGWNEAALSLYAGNPHSTDLPEWIKGAYAKALKSNRGLKEAIAYLALQEETSKLKWMKANYLLQDERVEAAQTELAELASQNSPESPKAALLLAELAFRQGAWDDAKNHLNKQPEALNSLKGQTLLARIALQIDDENEAEKIYENIQDSSIEAKSFLAKRAFEAGDYKKAYRLTEALLNNDPSNKVLRENLQQLLEAEKRQGA